MSEAKLSDVLRKEFGACAANMSLQLKGSGFETGHSVELEINGDQPVFVVETLAAQSKILGFAQGLPPGTHLHDVLEYYRAEVKARDATATPLLASGLH